MLLEQPNVSRHTQAPIYEYNNSKKHETTNALMRVDTKHFTITIEAFEILRSNFKSLADLKIACIDG